MKESRKKIFVGVSGGVDSSVALALLQEQGHDVTGVFLKVWQPDFLTGDSVGNSGCDWREERRSAMRVCATLGVPFMTLDCEAEYKKEVVDYMIREYAVGRVPNPDIFCNKYVKFGVFLEKALTLGADYVATGHYARLKSKENFKNENDQTLFELLESVDVHKDQSYFLYTLNQHQLAHTLFPVGHLTKPEVRKLAEKFNLPTATKKDSQGLCFIGKVDMKEFLQHFIETKKGDVLDTLGNVIGSHSGALLFAIGERHGFIITKKSSHDPRFFVVSKDVEKNTLTVASKKTVYGGGKNNKETGLTREVNMYNAKEIYLAEIHFISSEEPQFPFCCEVRIRFRQEKQKCVIKKKSFLQTSDVCKYTYTIVCDSSQSGVSAGQSAVFYFDDVCLGGGIIEAVI